MLGVLDDPRVGGHPHPVVVNIGNFHTLAFQFRDGQFVRLFEHHTGELTPGRLADWLRTLVARGIQHEAVFADKGHGALRLDNQALALDFVALVGPRRAMLANTDLPICAAVPHGDQMLTGCYGLLRACADIEPDWRQPISDACREGRSQLVVGLETGSWQLPSRRLQRNKQNGIRSTEYASPSRITRSSCPNPTPLKSILRMFNYGLFVAASTAPTGRAATVSWATQASFEQKLIAVAMRKGTAICEAVHHQRFALHVVGSQQTDFAKAFFKAPSGRMAQLGGYRYGLTASRSWGPRLPGWSARWWRKSIDQAITPSLSPVLSMVTYRSPAWRRWRCVTRRGITGGDDRGREGAPIPSVAI